VKTRLALNLGGRRGYSVLEVIRAVEYVTGPPGSANDGARGGAGDPPVLVADPAEGSKLAGMERKTQFQRHRVECVGVMRKIERREAA